MAGRIGSRRRQQGKEKEEEKAMSVFITILGHVAVDVLVKVLEGVIGKK